jgi:hypothetical protein
MNLIYYHPIAIKNKQPFQKVINPLISVLDRAASGRRWPDYDYLNLFPMPRKFSSKNFQELSVNRIRELTDNTKQIKLLWSGGIDSTYIACLMIDLGIMDQLLEQGRLQIGLNADSIKENPVFFDRFLKKYIPVIVQSDVILKTPKEDEVIITGEMADNLVGSLTMKSCVDYYNDFAVVHETWKGRGLQWLSRNLDAAEKPQLVSFIEETVAESPVELSTTHDLFWYLNFNFKWQAVNFRIVSHAINESVGNQLIKNLAHFFNTRDFQEWSMAEGHYFQGNSWGDYKSVMKKYIYQVNGDTEYFKHKTKFPSLPALLRYKDTFDFIYKDEDIYRFTKQEIQ